MGPTFQVDLTTGWDLSDSFYLGFNSTYLSTEPQEEGDASGFYGVALYPQIKTSENFTIGFRGEYFGVYNNGLAAFILDNEGDGNVFAATLTGSYTVGELTLKPEFRIDTTSEDTFVDNDSEFTDSLTSFVVGAIYKF